MKEVLEKIEIRMYYTGFGDCFVLTFYYQDQPKPKSIWIDFGSRAGEPETMQSIAKDICTHLTKSNSEPRIDVLAITHEHEDHISGFSENQAQAELAGLQIDQLWFAWTENAENPLAKEWRDYQNSTRKTLKAAFRAMAMSPTSNSQRLDRLKNLFGFDVGSQALDDDKSVTDLGQEVYPYLRKKTEESRGQVEYKRPGDLITDFPGIRIYVLGPPEDMSYVRKEQSGRSGELYLQANYAGEEYSLGHSLGINLETESSSTTDTDNSVSIPKKDFWSYVQKAPFDEEFVLPLPDDDAHPEALIPQGYQTPVLSQYVNQFNSLKNTAVYSDYFKDENKWRRIDGDYLNAADTLAMRLNSSTNNTSLVLAFEIIDSGEVLFFPGDAQYGVWLSWQEDFDKTQPDATLGQKIPKAKFVDNYSRKYQWSIPDQTDPAQKKTVVAEDLLKKTIVYKVGHHGSHNATPKRTGLEKMLSPNLLALIPVDEEKALSFRWDEIPYLNLLAALEKRKATYIRSDQLDKVENPTAWTAPTQWKITYELEQNKSKCLLCTLMPGRS